MKILVAPDSFKESLSALEACEAITEGIRRVAPNADIDQAPMGDGGEGTVDALVAATGGRMLSADAHGPYMETLTAQFGMLGDGRTAVIEMAAASGLPLVPMDRRDPTKTTTYGTGELVCAALDEGAKKIILGIGGSATTDGGAGCAQALGIEFRQTNGQAVKKGIAGGALDAVAVLDIAGRASRLDSCEIVVACDVDNPLTGPRGAAAVFGPQKGATPDQIEQLDANLKHLASLVRDQLDQDVETIPGAGAAGGLGAGLVGFLGATLQSGIDIVMEAVDLPNRMKEVDLVITGEGAIDRTSLHGKTAIGVARHARNAATPIIAFCGTVGTGAVETLDHIDAYFSIVNRPMKLSEATTDAKSLLTCSVEQAMRVWMLGGSRKQG
jgi:glycerate kinase